MWPPFTIEMYKKSICPKRKSGRMRSSGPTTGISDPQSRYVGRGDPTPPQTYKKQESSCPPGRSFLHQNVAPPNSSRRMFLLRSAVQLMDHMEANSSS